MPTNSPVGASQSNGRAENAIQRVTGQIRTMKSDLEGHLGIQIGPGHPLFPWMVKWAGELLTRFVVGETGRSAYEQIKGKASTRALAKFGEKILYMPMKSTANIPAKTEEKLKEGIFLGARFKSDEIIVGTENGVLKARTIKRMTEDKQWDREFLRNLQGTPRQPDPKVVSDQIHASLRNRVEPDQDLHVGAHGQPAEVPPEVPVASEVNRPRPEPAARRMYVRKREIEKYGPTPGCQGCRAIARGTSATHTETCRDRMKKLMTEDEEGRKRLKQDLERMDKYFERQIERAVENDPDLQIEQEVHDQEMEEIRKRRLDIDEPEEANRDVRNKRSVRDEARGRDNAGGSSSSGLKRKAEEMPEDELERCIERDSEEDVVIGHVEAHGSEENKSIKVMHLNDATELDCFGTRNGLLHRIKNECPDVIVTDVGEILAGARNFLGVVYKMQEKNKKSYVHWSSPQGGAVETWLNYLGRRMRKDASGRRFVTNNPGIALYLETDSGPDSVVHGCKAHKHWQSANRTLIGAVLPGAAGASVGDVEHAVPPEEPTYDYEGCAWDDISGKELDPQKVRAARALEVEYYRKMDVFDKVPIEECYQVTGKAPIKTKWIDHDKGSRYRSRWVAKEFKDSTDEDWFATTPPLEALRAILSDATTGNIVKAVMLNDVSRAFFYAPIQDHHFIYVELCEEILEDGEAGRVCGRLKKSMYGTKAAAQNWQRAVQNAMASLGFRQGRSSPVLFYHDKRDIKTLVHGDDFLSSGKPEDLAWFKGELEKKFDITTTTMGEGPGLENELKILNRKVTWHDGVGISYEADPKHVEAILRETGAGNLSSVKTPMIREDGVEARGAKEKDIVLRKMTGTLGKKVELEGEQLLNAEDTSKYRGIAARANYLAADRPDIMFPAKELCRRMSAPTESDWARLVRLGRYLKGCPTVKMWYKLQKEQNFVQTYSDTDWAGCRRTRRSTTGGYTTLGSHVLKTWCKTQATIALSSAEAELYGLVRASAETLGTLSMYKDFGIRRGAQVFGDASAALGIIHRQGLGKMRHLDTSYLWIQEKAMNEELQYQKIAGNKNAADLFTKVLAWDRMKQHMEGMQTEFVGVNVLGILERKINDLVNSLKLERRTRTWLRTDLASRTAKSTVRGGPDYRQVVARVAVDAATGETLVAEDLRRVGRDELHRPIAAAPRDIVTGIVYLV